MTIRAAAMLCSVLVACATGFLPGCSSQAPAAETPAAASSAADAPEPAARPEQALLDDLALANRILARQLDILDIQGHVTARSRTNPNHYYIARFLSPGGVTTSDFIENDLDSTPVEGPRTDQAREIYLHGEIYKARPDVMAVVHAHTPEFVAFGMSSVPLWNGDSMVPVWDIRPFNKGRSGIVNTPALGKAMAEKLGNNEAVLLWGHGIAFTASSVPDAVSRVDDLRNSARLQQAVIAMGGAWKSRAAPHHAGAERNRTWDYLKGVERKRTGGRAPTSPAPAPARPANHNDATIRDLVLANRILVSDELGILDTLGLVSVRNPRNPTSYFVAPRVSPGAVTAADVLERDMTRGVPDSQGLAIHDEVYKARPDVMALLYAGTPEIVAFTEGAVTLRPVVNGGAFIGNGLPVFNIGNLSNPAAGRGVAEALGKSGAVLVSGQGVVLTAGSIYNLVDRAYQLRQNAKIQQQAIALRGRVAYLNERPAEPVQPNEPAQPAPTGPPEGRAWIYWSENVTVD